jgi:hypothetical protein
MPTDDDDFDVDPKSARDAEQLAEALRRRHLDILGNAHGVLSEFPYFLELSEENFTQPLNEMAQEIPLKDVQIDVHEFGLLALLFRSRGLDFPVRLMGEGAVLVPILPPIGLLQLVFGRSPFPNPLINFYDFYLGDVVSFIYGLLRSAAGDNERSTTRPLEIAQQAFFKGLEPFLTARIAGVRWARKQDEGPPPGGGGRVPPLASGGPPPAGKASGSAQLWKVHTVGSGLSLYYGGTHATRTTGIYLNGTTTPLQVFLPMGTLYLAADAGPGGALVWDDKKGHLRVPSYTPTYTTKSF